ncbi:hypothetical protein TgHK011_009314 [Trichoderma gracile]|nr:hypothetical protein TgHK011_009314 [Trichoderma gracile]
MAPKKRKGRRTARRRGPQTAPRHDSCSDDGGSDDFPSAMTRLEGAGQDTEERCDDNGAEPIDDEDDFEVASLYPASQLAGGARSTYRSGGGHFVTGDPRAMASDFG